MTEHNQSVADGKNRIGFGIQGLDDILHGGLTPYRLYLVEGVPGAGKTTLAMQFLLEGARHGESVLYVTLSETEEELRMVAVSHGWSLHDGVDIHELVPSESLLDGEQPEHHVLRLGSGNEQKRLRRFLRKVEQLKPTRVVIDSLSEMRLLADGSSCGTPAPNPGVEALLLQPALHGAVSG